MKAPARVRLFAKWTITFAVAFFSRAALATPSSKLTYARGLGAEQCPDEETLRKAVAARLGYDPFFPWATKTIVAQIVRAKSGFRGLVQILDDHGVALGERVVDSPASDCRELLNTLALAISISIDDLVDTEAVSTPPSKTIVAVDPPATAARPIPATRAIPVPVFHRRAEPTSLELQVGIVGSLGTAPAPSLGALIGIGVRRSFFSLGLEARSDLPASESVSHGRIESSLLLGSLVPCAHLGRFFFGCALFSLGSFSARATEAAFPISSHALFYALGPRVGIELPLASHLWAYVHADALFTLTPHRLEFDNRDVFSLPTLSGSLNAGILTRFP